MNLSKYTTFLTIDDRHSIVYNALTQKFTIIKGMKLTAELLTDSFFDEHPSIKEELTKSGIIIPEGTDEEGELISCLQKHRINENEFIIHINPTLDCNLRCWYCYEKHIQNSKMPLEVKRSINKLIDKITSSKTIKTLQLGFFGGEPFLQFEECAVPLIEYANKQCREHNIHFKVNFTTNGTLLEASIIKYLSQFECGFQITLDGGKSHHDKTRFYKGGHGTFDSITGNIILAAKYGIDTIVRINYTDDNVNSIDTVYDLFANLHENVKNHLRFDFQRVWQTKAEKEEFAEAKITSFRHKFNESGLSVLPNFILNNVVSPCYGDMKNYLMINYNGEIFGCTARDFTTDNKIGQISSSGDILYNKLKLKIRNESQLHKKICRNCRIAPLCGGGCKQNASESYEKEFCHMGYSEADKDKFVLDIIYYTIYPDLK